MNLESVVEIISKYSEKDIYKITKENDVYTLSQIISIYNDLKNCENATSILNNFNIHLKLRLSKRRALIIILEEQFHNFDQYPIHIDLQIIEKKAKIRFRFGHSNKNNLNTPQKIHPKNPCLHYEDSAKAKRQYIDSLVFILEKAELLFEIDEAIRTLSNTLEEVKLC